MLQKISFLSLQMLWKVELSTFPQWENYFLVSLVQEVHIYEVPMLPSAQHDDKAFEGRVPQKFGGNTDPASLFTEI